MRIRYYAYFYPPCVGGGEVILQHQAEELARRGHEVHVHTTPYTNLNLSSQLSPGSRVERGVHVHRRWSARVPVHNPLEADIVTPSVAVEAFLPADLLVSVGYPSVHLSALVRRSRLLGTPLLAQNYVTAAFLEEILEGRGGWKRQLRARLWKGPVREELAACRRVLADSPAAARALGERLGLDNVRCHVGMAVDPSEFAAVGPQDGAAVRARLGLGGDRLILAPSRLAHQKGPDLLVRAVGPVLRAGWRVVLSGAVNDPALAAEVDRLAAPYGRQIVRAEVSRSELVALLLESEVVVLPSRGETVGGVVFEGMYAGALVLVSDAVEAARDLYLQDGQNGFLVAAENVDAWRAALVKAMDGAHAEVRAAGRRDAEATWTWPRSVDRLWALYEEALA